MEAESIRLTHRCRNCQKMDTVHIDGKCPFEATNFYPMTKDELEEYNHDLFESLFRDGQHAYKDGL